MRPCILALDVGGTSIKYALLGEDAHILTGTQGQADACAQGEAAAILGAFSGVGQLALAQASALGRQIVKVSVAMPGPFDFQAGVSHMSHKFQGVQGIPLAPAIQTQLPGVPVVFLHDSTAFMLGEGILGAAAGYRVPAGIMLGTGFGFACMRGGKVLVNLNRRPALSLWNAPYQGGIFEDFVSRRAIRSRFGTLSGITSPPDVREIALLAREGHRAALDTFEQTGSLLARMIGPVLDVLGSDILVIGGQIARSGDLFLPAVAARLGIKTCLSSLGENAAFLGAGLYAQRGRAETEAETDETDLGMGNMQM